MTMDNRHQRLATCLPLCLDKRALNGYGPVGSLFTSTYLSDLSESCGCSSSSSSCSSSGSSCCGDVLINRLAPLLEVRLSYLLERCSAPSLRRIAFRCVWLGFVSDGDFLLSYLDEPGQMSLVDVMPSAGSLAIQLWYFDAARRTLHLLRSVPLSKREYGEHRIEVTEDCVRRVLVVSVTCEVQSESCWSCVAFVSLPQLSCAQCAGLLRWAVYDEGVCSSAVAAEHWNPANEEFPPAAALNAPELCSLHCWTYKALYENRLESLEAHCHSPRALSLPRGLVLLKFKQCISVLRVDVLPLAPMLWSLVGNDAQHLKLNNVGTSDSACIQCYRELCAEECGETCPEDGWEHECTLLTPIARKSAHCLKNSCHFCRLYLTYLMSKSVDVTDDDSSLTPAFSIAGSCELESVAETQSVGCPGGQHAFTQPTSLLTACARLVSCAPVAHLHLNKRLSLSYTRYILQYMSAAEVSAAPALEAHLANQEHHYGIVEECSNSVHHYLDLEPLDSKRPWFRPSFVRSTSSGPILVAEEASLMLSDLLQRHGVDRHHYLDFFIDVQLVGVEERQVADDANSSPPQLEFLVCVKPIRKYGECKRMLFRLKWDLSSGESIFFKVDKCAHHTIYECQEHNSTENLHLRRLSNASALGDAPDSLRTITDRLGRFRLIL